MLQNQVPHVICCPGRPGGRTQGGGHRRRYRPFPAAPGAENTPTTLLPSLPSPMAAAAAFAGRIRDASTGDIRNCLLALANFSDAMGELLNYRFPEGSLKGQSFGNLFLLALNGVCGSFRTAVARMNDFLAVTGQVLPVTTSNVRACVPSLKDGSCVTGRPPSLRPKKNRTIW